MSVSQYNYKLYRHVPESKTAEYIADFPSKAEARAAVTAIRSLNPLDPPGTRYLAHGYRIKEEFAGITDVSVGTGWHDAPCACDEDGPEHCPAHGTAGPAVGG